MVLSHLKTDHLEEHEVAAQDRTLFGFWVYLMTDLIMFGILFATFSVLRTSTYGGVPLKHLFELPFVLQETLILLISSFTCGLAMIAAHNKEKFKTLFLLVVTFAFGLAFLVLEIQEFSKFIAEGYGPWRSGAMSSFFTLVGTHGLHITVGLLWMTVLMVAVWIRGLTHANIRKLMLFSLFWHFLDIVWIFIFTVVYFYAFV